MRNSNESCPRKSSSRPCPCTRGTREISRKSALPSCHIAASCRLRISTGSCPTRSCARLRENSQKDGSLLNCIYKMSLQLTFQKSYFVLPEKIIRTTLSLYSWQPSLKGTSCSSFALYSSNETSVLYVCVCVCVYSCHGAAGILV